MNWLIGSKQGEAKKRIAQLADATKRERAAQDLIRMDMHAVPSIIEALQTKDENLFPYYQQILAQIPSATPLLIKTLREAHPILRGRVAEIFGISKDHAAIPTLVDALQGEYYTVRSRAALALGKIGDPKTIRPLLIVLKDKEDEVRSAACLAVGLFRDPATFDEITNVLLDDLKIEVRQAAVRALGNTQHAAALPYLLEALHDSFGGMNANTLQEICYQPSRRWVLRQLTHSSKHSVIRKGLCASLPRSCLVDWETHVRSSH
jgi:HEAT repeat protein